MFFRHALIVALCSVALITAVEARSKKKTGRQQSSFAYYMLVLSYAPDFCDQGRVQKDPRECGAGRKVGYVVHGLWPQGETSRGPENCGSGSPVSDSIVQSMLQYFPTASLIQHEWKTHGTCSGLSVNDYFALVKKARDSVQIPAELSPASRQSMAPSQIESRMARANPGFPATAFRTSCWSDQELEEIRICLNKDGSPRACGVSAGECRAPQVTVLPPR